MLRQEKISHIKLAEIFEAKILDRVPVLLINSEKRVSHPTFEENTERFLCSLFSVTWGHDQFLELPRNGNLRKFYMRSFKKAKHSEALLETESWRPCF